jgi:hypothetical protein
MTNTEEETQQRISDCAMLDEVVAELVPEISRLRQAQRLFAQKFRMAAEQRLGLCNVEITGAIVVATRIEADEKDRHPKLTIDVGGR